MYWCKGLHSTHGTWTKNIYRDEHYRRDFTSDNEYNRKAGVELIMNRVNLAAALGASEIVLHLYIPFLTLGTDEQAKEAFYVQVEKSLDELQPYCLEKGVRICMENLFEFPEEWMLYSWDRLFARYPKEFLGVCYDAGHANMRWHADAIDVLKKYSDRIFCVHLHDNMDTMDAHLLPGMGTVNWDAAMELLAKSAYELPLTFVMFFCGISFGIYAIPVMIAYILCGISILPLTWKILNPERKKGKKFLAVILPVFLLIVAIIVSPPVLVETFDLRTEQQNS